MCSAGIRVGEIDLAGISTRLDNAARGQVSGEPSLISGGVKTSLFSFDRSTIEEHDDDLDAALRSRGHPGLRIQSKLPATAPSARTSAAPLKTSTSYRST